MKIDNLEINERGFTMDIINKLLELGYGTLSKNDFYDFVLYCINKHDANNFLDKQSNYQNSIMLKTTESKIKTIKLNIAQKYKSKDERKNILSDFLFKIYQGEIKLVDNKSEFTFFIEDNVVRMEIEAMLKSLSGITLDYKLNTEKVTIDKSDFIQLLIKITNRNEDYFTKLLIQDLKFQQIINKNKEVGGKFIDTLKEIATDITSTIFIEMIKKTANF